MSEFVRDQPGEQADAEFQQKSFRRVENVNRVDQIADGHADGAAESPIDAAEQQSADNADRVAEMNRSGIAAGQRDFDL